MAAVYVLENKASVSPNDPESLYTVDVSLTGVMLVPMVAVKVPDIVIRLTFASPTIPRSVPRDQKNLRLKKSQKL